MADPHAHPGISDDPVRFTEAIDALRDKVPMTKALFDELTVEQRQFAFTIANVAQADIVTDVLEYMESAVRDGSTFEEFVASDPAGRLTEAWGGANPARLETLFRTTTMTAYNEGRFRQLTLPEVTRARPYWRFDVIGDADLCPICRPCDGLILPADHRWWRTHYCPLHPNCRCIVTALTEGEAREQGISTSPPSVKPVTGFGIAPSSGGSDWEPDTGDYQPAVAAVLEERLG